MANTTKLTLIPDEVVINKIYFIRGQKVMLDEDLAELYQVETKRLNEQVKRNMQRFPEDFMFQLTRRESENLKSQIAASSWGGRRKLPFAFAEQGVAILSGVLNSETAMRVNIQIIRIFTKMRELSGMLYSLLGTCKMHGIEPYSWLKTVLQKIAEHPINKVHELLPHLA